MNLFVINSMQGIHRCQPPYRASFHSSDHIIRVAILTMFPAITSSASAAFLLTPARGYWLTKT